jgi:hypothetical protein
MKKKFYRNIESRSHFLISYYTLNISYYTKCVHNFSPSDLHHYCGIIVDLKNPKLPESLDLYAPICIAIKFIVTVELVDNMSYHYH